MKLISGDETCSFSLRANDADSCQPFLDQINGSAQGKAGHHRPHLNALLRSFGLDVHYHRALGESVYCKNEVGQEVEVLDLVSGYGSLLLGHNHPALTGEAIAFLQSGVGNHLQGSVSRLAARLASELSRRARGDYCTVFANSGAEGVEAAIKHALLETGGQKFIALEGAFHGKTLGSLQLTSSSFYREPFALDGLNVDWVRPNDIDHLERVFTKSDRLAGFFFEPIQGEGGVRPVNRAFLQRAAELCREYRIPFIADECQTGLGRTGTFLASQSLDLEPDYVILSKALGGGIAKISALLIKRARYEAQFDLLHSSTFSADAFSCTIALKTLELLDDSMLADCRRNGSVLKRQLRALQEKYPSIVADVRGTGLMLGVELKIPSAQDSFILRFLESSNLLGLCVAGNLFKQHRIRAAPTISDHATLRVQPPATVCNDSLTRFVDALEKVLAQLDCGDIAGLTAFLSSSVCESDASPASWPAKDECITFRPVPRVIQRRDATAPRVAWLFHMINANDLQHLDPALCILAPVDQENYINRLAPIVKPVVMDPTPIYSETGESVELYPILLPVTSRWLKSQYERRRFRKLRTLVQQGVDVAAALSCDVVSLGQFTSIVTGHGRHLDSREIGITSGNSLPAAIAIDAVLASLSNRGLAASDLTIAIVGAGGDIGRVCAEILVPEFHSATLVGSGRPGSMDRLQQVARICGATDATSDLEAVQGADVVVCATSCVDFALTTDQLAEQAIVCDVSVPHTFDFSLRSCRSDVTLLQGGIIRLPGSEDLGIPGLPLPSGCAYGCLGEGVLFAWQRTRDRHLTGRTSIKKVLEISALAARHGFCSADLETFDSEVSTLQG
ncbi:MAG: aminotransferase class III-fold pyridoxal phosphate-dependent enzyme, partial [Bythopirellula sp.]